MRAADATGVKATQRCSRVTLQDFFKISGIFSCFQLQRLRAPIFAALSVVAGVALGDGGRKGGGGGGGGGRGRREVEGGEVCR
jgi:uncharacterized membrane protein